MILSVAAFADDVAIPIRYEYDQISATVRNALATQAAVRR